MAKSPKSYLALVLKVSFVLGLLYFLSQKGFLSLQQTRQAVSNWQYFVPAAGCLIISTLLGIARWQLLLQSQGIRLNWGRVTQLTLIGNFFNIALPGAVSGDFVKAFYIGKELGGPRARAFGSILFDRVAGLSALVFVSAGALVLGLAEFQHSALLAGTRFFVVTAATCALAFYFYLFLVREHHDPVLKILRSLEARFTRAGSIVRIYESLRHYHNHRLTVCLVLLISVAIHLLVGWACFTFSRALDPVDLPLLAVYVVVPLGLLVTAIPIAPGGIGTGNLAFAVLFNFLGSQRGGDIYTLLALINLMIGAVGGLVYLRFRADEPSPNLGPELGPN